MGNKMLKLEAAIKEIKSIKHKLIISDGNNPIEKEDEDIRDKTQDQNIPDQGVKYHDEAIVTRNKKETVNETDQETPKLVKSGFKCHICGASFKKEITMKKYINTKHDDQNCKVCQKGFKTSMEVLKHVAKEHSKNIVPNISVKEKEKLTEQDDVDISDCEDNIDNKYAIQVCQMQEYCVTR